MTAHEQPAHVSLAGGATSPTCEACGSASATATTTLLVEQARGGAVQLGLCDWCVRAVRRLAAVTGGHARFSLSEAAGPPPGVGRGAPQVSRESGPPVVIADLSTRVTDGSGVSYVVRAVGRERYDGTWEGWLEFISSDGATRLATGRETTQSKHEDLVYWSTGIEPSYLQGALSRARRDTAAR